MQKKLIFKRSTFNRINEGKIDSQLNFVSERSISSSRGKGWSCKIVKNSVKQDTEPPFKWNFIFSLEYETQAEESKANNQWEAIYSYAVDAGKHTQFTKYPWEVIGGDIPSGTTERRKTLIQEGVETEATPDDVREVTNPRVINIEEMRELFPHELLGKNSDEAIEAHPAFSRIYGRNAQIRAGLSAIHSFLFTKGKRSSHFCYDGPPGCGKTKLLEAMVKVFGEGCCLKLDATSTTKAGIERLYFETLDEIPPLCLIEEIEKADESGLTVWLGALDERKEVRKVNFKVQKVRHVNFLAMCTSNNRPKFKSILEGALASRFKNQWECPRPDKFILHKILERDIHENGGNVGWIEPVLDIADQLGENDPRLVLAWLDGGDRLLTGEYQKDIMEIYNKEEKKEK